MRFATADVRPRGPAPALGADTRAVLAEAGIDTAEIDRLLDAGTVAAIQTDGMEPKT
jgi:crotonobetainyl-CoA:carnitine CoA-transferase CaiB-like acyl-CoA transferase